MNASYDQNNKPTLLAVSTVDQKTPVPLEADPSTGALLVSGGGGGGTGTADVQYIDGSTRTTPTGTLGLGYDGTNVHALKTDATGQLYIANPGSGTGGGLSTNDGTFAKETGGNLATVATNTGNIPAKGQTTSTGSTPVVIASDQSTVPVSVSGVATAANQSTEITSLGTIATNTGRIPAQGAAVKAASLPVNIASDQTVPVSLATAPTTPVTGTFWQATQPVSGSVTSNQGTANTAANAWFIKNSDGTNTAAVKAASTAPLTTDAALVVTVSPNSAAHPVTLNAGSNVAGKFGIDQTTPGTTNGVQIVAALPTGANPIGSITNTGFTATQATAANLNATVVGTGTFAVQATQSGTWTVQPGNIANTTPWLVATAPSTSGGLSSYSGSIGGTVTAVKTSAGQVYGYHFLNTTAAVAYVQIFNLATGSVTLGTTSPTLSIGIPASGGATVNFDKGIAFGTAISFACTTTRSGSTGATVDVNFFYA